MKFSVSSLGITKLFGKNESKTSEKISANPQSSVVYPFAGGATKERFPHNQKLNDDTTYQQGILKPAVETANRHQTQRARFFNNHNLHGKRPDNTSAVNTTAAVNGLQKDTVSFQDADYVDIYKKGSENLKKKLEKEGIKIPGNIASGFHKSTGHRRSKTNEEKLSVYKNVRRFACHKMMADVKTVSALFKTAGNGKDIALNATSIDELNVFFKRNFGVTLPKSVVKASKKAFEAEIGKRPPNMESIKAELLRHFDLLMAKVPFGAEIKALAEKFKQEELEQTRHAEDNVRKFSLEDGSVCEKISDNEFKLIRPYGTETRELHFRKKDEDKNFLLELHSVDAEGNRTPIALDNEDAWSGVQRHFDNASVLKTLFGDGVSIRKTGFDALYGRLKANETAEREIADFFNQPIKDVLDERLKDCKTFHGTGFSYNGARQGEKLGIESRNVVMGLIHEKAQNGDLAIDGSCDFQQDLLWHTGSHIVKAGTSLAELLGMGLEASKAVEGNRKESSLASTPLKETEKASGGLPSTDEPPMADKLAAFQQKLRKWEEDHPLDPEKIVQAMKLVAQGHAEKHWFEGRNSKYSQAEKLMREGLGIDDATWKRARHAIGMQGLTDIYDSAATVLILGPALAATAGLGAEALGEIGGKAVKYASMWAGTVASSAAGQIMVDVYQDQVVAGDGMPVDAPEFNKSPTYSKFAEQASGKIKEAATLCKELADPATDQARRERIGARLEAILEDMDELHAGYQRRTARGIQNLIKCTTQLPYKMATAPAIVAAGIHGGPFALWGASVVQQAAQAPFAYVDEILVKKHVMRSNAKYADLLTDDAKAKDITRNSPELSASDISEAKARKLWSHPVDVVHDNVAMVYTDELATLLRKERKLEKNLSKLKVRDLLPIGETSQGVRKLKKSLVEREAKRNELQGRLYEIRTRIETLKKDIVIFKKGVHAIKNGDDDMDHWRELSPEGTIAAMLTNGLKHYALLARAKFRRPGEYTAQIVDRHGGSALPGTFIGAFVDGFKLSERASEARLVDGFSPEEIGPGATSQAGAMASTAMYGPIANFTKQLYVKNLGLPKKEAQQESDQVLRKSFLGEKKTIPSGIVQLEDGITVDMQHTRAYYNESRSKAYRIAEGLGDAAKGFALHMKAAATFPVNYGVGAVSDHQLKKARNTVKQALEKNNTKQAFEPHVAGGAPGIVQDEAAAVSGQQAGRIESARKSWRKNNVIVPLNFSSTDDIPGIILEETR